LPATGFTWPSASTDFNKIVLLDKTGRTKYTLSRDDFMAKMQKLERKLDRKQQKEERLESVLGVSSFNLSDRFKRHFAKTFL
jgi:hypothetical protein